MDEDKLNLVPDTDPSYKFKPDTVHAMMTDWTALENAAKLCFIKFKEQDPGGARSLQLPFLNNMINNESADLSKSLSNHREQMANQTGRNIEN